MSAKATELLEAEGASNILSPGATRWNNSYLMMNAIVKIESAKRGLLNKATEELRNSVNVTDRDVAILKEMCLILEPIANVRLEADSVPTSGLVDCQSSSESLKLSIKSTIQTQVDKQTF